MCETRTLLSGVELISLSDPANPGDAAGGQNASMSGDGRYVVFESLSTNLVAGQIDTNNATDIFLLDRDTGVISLVSHTGDGLTTANSQSANAKISDDGSTIVYESNTTNLVSGVTYYSGTNIFLYSAYTDSNRLVSHRNDNPLRTGNHDSSKASLSADGNTVVFQSQSTDLINWLTNENGYANDVFVYSALTDNVQLVSHIGDGETTGNQTSFNAVISADGSAIAYQSYSTDLINGMTDDNGTGSDIFLYSVSSASNSLVSHTAGDYLTTGNKQSYNPVISADGTTLAYESTSSNLISGGMFTSSYRNIFVYSTVTDTSSLVSHVAGNELGTVSGHSMKAVISADGSAIAYQSQQRNLVSGMTDTNGSGYDVFLYSVATATNSLVNHTGDGLKSSDNESINAVISADGSAVAYESTSTDILVGMPQEYGIGSTDVFLYSVATATNSLISHKGDGLTGAGLDSENAILSTDGSIVIFQSRSLEIDENSIDYEYTTDLFAFDTATTQVELLSTLNPVVPNRAAGVKIYGEVLSSIESYPISVSADGRYVVYESNARNILPGVLDNNGFIDVFLLDRKTGVTSLVSHLGDGVTTGLSNSFNAQISANGSAVVYQSGVRNLVSGMVDANVIGTDLFLYDVATGTNRLISHSGDSLTTGNGQADSAVISADGKTVAFVSSATNLVEGVTDANGHTQDVFLFSAETNAIRLVSHTGDELTTGNYRSLNPNLSADGFTVAFESQATDLIDGVIDVNGTDSDVFLFLAGTSNLRLVSHTGDGITTGNDNSYSASISADGSMLAFGSSSTNLVSGMTDTNGSSSDIFQYSTATNSNLLVSHTGDGLTTGNGKSEEAEISKDGSAIVFQSEATNLISGVTDTNGSDLDVFLYSIATGSNNLVSHSWDSLTTGDNESYNASISADGKSVAYESIATNLLEVFYNRNATTNGQDVFLYTSAERSNLLVSHTGNGVSTSRQGAYEPALSEDGKFIGFYSAGDFMKDDFNQVLDVYALQLPPETIVVTTRHDENDGTIDPTQGTGTSLREAIIAANAYPDSNIITFASNLFGGNVDVSLDSFDGLDEDESIYGDFDITSHITIMVSDPRMVKIYGAWLPNEPFSGDRIFEILSGGTLVLDNVTVSRGENEKGAGLFVNEGGTLEVNNSIITDNESTTGGGIYNLGELSITNSTISRNTAVTDGAGLYNNGNAVIKYSTFAYNTSGGYGGGIFNDDSGELTVINTTISQNSASTGGALATSGTTLIRNSTFAYNTADLVGGIIESGGSTTLYNSIISDHTTGDLQGTFTGANNLIEDGSGTGLFGTITGDPRLEDLKINGGATHTHALLKNSIAIDAGNDSFAIDEFGHSLTRDQRTSLRFVNTVDIGAYEAITETIVITTAVDENDGSLDPDAGTGISLREAIIAANISSGLNHIVFDQELNNSPFIFSLETTDPYDHSANFGDLVIKDDLIIEGNGIDVTILDGGQIDRLFAIENNATVEISNLTLSGGSATVSGGAIYMSSSTVNIDTVAFRNNYSGSTGGAISVHSSQGFLTVKNSYFYSNTAEELGGGIYLNYGNLDISNTVFDSNIALDDGGGIYGWNADVSVADSYFTRNVGSNNGGGIHKIGTNLRITNSTFAQNIANRGAGVYTNYVGTVITNSTFSGNTSGTQGSAIYTDSLLPTIILNSTFINNHAYSATSSSSGKVIYKRYSSNDVLIHNTLIANNITGLGKSTSGISDNFNSNSSNNLIDNPSQAGSLIHNTNGNIIGDGLGNLLSVDQIIDPVLRDNGSGIPTHSLVSNSVAIDAGNPLLLPDDVNDVDGDSDISEPIPFDQRGVGYVRILGSGLDIGAFEYNPQQVEISLDSSNNLLISSINGTSDDELTLKFDDQNNQLIITDANNLLVTSIFGANGNNSNSITIPITSFSGENIIFNGGAGDDVLIVDFSLGEFTKNIIFNGEGQTKGDELVLTGGSFDTVTHSLTNANDGSIDLDGITITYTGLEPISDYNVAVNRVFEFTGAAETITLSDNGISDDGFSLIDSTLGESVAFANPTGALTINTTTGSGTDFINVERLDSSFDANLNIITDRDTGEEDVVTFQTNTLDLGTGALYVTGDEIQLDVGINTGGSQLFSGKVLLGADLTLLSGDTVTFTNSLDGTHNLVVEAEGDVNFNGNVGDDQALASLTIDDSSHTTNNVNFFGSLNTTGSFTQNAGSGTTVFLDSTIGLNLDVTTNNVIFLLGSSQVSGTVSVDAATSIEVGGAIETSGSHGIQFDAGQDIGINSHGSLTTDNGNLTLNANVSGTTTGEFSGIAIDGGSLTTTSGAITLTGTGGNTGVSTGILLSDNAKVESHGAGTITLNGFGHGMGNGIEIESSAQILSTDGNIQLTGITTGNKGVTLEAGLISTDGTASVTINGTGGTTGDGHGVNFDSASQIELSGSGSIDVTGTSTMGSEIRLALGPDGFINTAATGFTLAYMGVQTYHSEIDIEDESVLNGLMINFQDGISGSSDLTIDLRIDGPSPFDVNDNGIPDIFEDLNGDGLIDGTNINYAQVAQFLSLRGSATVKENTTSDFAGNITIATGQFHVHGDTTNATSSVTVLSSAFLLGTGSILGDVFIENGGLFTPGPIPTQFELGNLTLNTGAIFAVDLEGAAAGTEYDQLLVTGASRIVNLNGSTLDIDLDGTFAPIVGSQFIIIDSEDAESDINGTFDGLAEGATFMADGQLFSITYAGGDGNDVVLTALANGTIVVTTANDENDGGLDPEAGAGVSLREAIIAANLNMNADTITFDPSLNGMTLLLTIMGTQEEASIDGDLDIKSHVSIDAQGQNITIDGGSDLASGGVDTGIGERIFHVLRNGFLGLKGITITGGAVEGPNDDGATPVDAEDGTGGGIRISQYAEGRIVDSIISGNFAESGGGIYSQGTLTILDSVITGNSTHGDGGGLTLNGKQTITNSIISGNKAKSGGGIYSYSFDLLIENSTISENEALFGGGLFISQNAIISGSTISNNLATNNGGGIYTLSSHNSKLTITNSTVSRNIANINGGGLLSHSSHSSTEIISSTFSENSAVAGGGIFAEWLSSTTLHNTIIANSTSGGDLAGIGIVFGSFNNIEDGQKLENLTNTIVGDPRLGALADNGGPTFTHALLDDSLAINAGNNALALDASMNALTTDQRGSGFDRIIGDRVDIGAYESTSMTGGGPTTRIDISPSSLGYGIPGQDNATGAGFILYSQQSVQQRFAGAVVANGAEHFVVVRFISNQWQYANNDVWVDFTPTTGDRLIAAIDFGSSQVQMLQGSSGSVNGINQGYVEGDLTITANQWRDVFNEGEFGITGTYFSVEQTTPQTTRVDISPSSLGYGIPGQDNATGNGFIMYSQQSVQQRFAGAIVANGAEHFLAVRFINNQWQYANNDVWVDFTPTTGDRLIAAIDFDSSQVQMLQGNTGSVNGINQGYVESDLTITPNQWRDRPNAGEFGITGTYFTLEQTTPQTTRVDITPSSLGYGIPGQDNATGAGFILYSQQSVQQRFAGAVVANGAEHFVVVRFISNQWQYANNDVWVDFTPTTGDRLIAAIDFGSSQVQMLQGSSGSVNGINQGYVEGDLTITANQWRDVFNEGEFGITGTYFSVEQTTPQTTRVDISPSSLGYGIPGQDNATGNGFIMYSQQSVQQRFAGAIVANGAEHFLAVRFINNQWQYANNDVWVDFTPTTGDRLIAAIDFDSSQVEMLRGSSGSVNGINQGYLESDLMITANQWRDVFNEGEFSITGTYFTFE
ncbi:choice-of-anchor Q domain-containing protein [uncultured Rubinisphaera sp.]|uniref:choice-of-anchor Q domain-containing protein n=2 Tax=Rubinisphaera TaxID=1649490 RepID=UPI0030D92827